VDVSAEHGRWQAAARAHLLQHFARNGAFGPEAGELPIIDQADGIRVRDTSGRWWIDGLSSLFCAQLGHGLGERFAEVAGAQLASVPYTTNWGMASIPAVRLAEELARRAPAGLEKVLFTSGGSESVEAAWKLVRSFHHANGQPERDVAVARRIAYHGVTLGALSFTGVPAMKEPFGRPAVETVRVSHTGAYREPDAGDERARCARLLAEVDEVVRGVGPERVAMLIAEPIQNAGGCLVPPHGYWRGLRELADVHGFLLVADEVISGFGRVGELFAVERYGGAPDLVTLAKGITSAHAPMGAVLVSDQVAEHLYAPGRTLLHGITFGGHPVSAAIALRNLELFDELGVLAHVRALTPLLAQEMERLLQLDCVGDVRGDGFFWAAELVTDATDDGRLTPAQRERVIRQALPAALREVALIARPDDRGEAVVQIAPPLIADADDLRAIVDRLGEAIAAAAPALRTPASVP